MILTIILLVLVVAVIVFLAVIYWPKINPKTNNNVTTTGSTPFDSYISNETSYGLSPYTYTYPTYTYTYPTYGYNNAYYGNGSGRNYYGYISL